MNMKKSRLRRLLGTSVAVSGSGALLVLLSCTPSSQSGQGGETCGGGQTYCGPKASALCVDVQADIFNCGSCIHECPHTACTLATCAVGQCGARSAPAGTACQENGGNVCDGNGTCVVRAPQDGGPEGDAARDAIADAPSDAVLDAPEAGGPAWTFQTPDARGRDLSDVWGSGANDVYVVGIQGAAYHSADNGATWQPVVIASADQFSGVWGTGASNVYAVSGQSNGIIYRYDGSTWGMVTTVTAPVFDIWGSSATDVYAVGVGGMILHSTDGVTFNPQTSGTTTDLLAVWGSGSGDVYAIGGVGGAPGIILHTSNGGTTWSTQHTTSVNSQALDGIWGPASGTVYVSNLQANALVVTTNGGTTWSAGPASPGSGGGLYGIWGSSSTDVYVAGATSTGALIAHYTGVGTMTAETLPATTTGDGFGAVWGSGATNVYAVGSGGRIAHKH